MELQAMLASALTRSAASSLRGHTEHFCDPFSLPFLAVSLRGWSMFPRSSTVTIAVKIASTFSNFTLASQQAEGEAPIEQDAGAGVKIHVGTSAALSVELAELPAGSTKHVQAPSETSALLLSDTQPFYTSSPQLTSATSSIAATGDSTIATSSWGVRGGQALATTSASGLPPASQSAGQSTETVSSQATAIEQKQAQSSFETSSRFTGFDNSAQATSSKTQTGTTQEPQNPAAPQKVSGPSSNTADGLPSPQASSEALGVGSPLAPQLPSQASSSGAASSSSTQSSAQASFPVSGAASSSNEAAFKPSSQSSNTAITSAGISSLQSSSSDTSTQASDQSVAEAPPIGGQVSVASFPPDVDATAADLNSDAEGASAIGNSDGGNDASSNAATADSSSSDQATVESTGSAVSNDTNQGQAADSSQNSADTPLDSTSSASDPSKPNASELGREFSATQGSESERRVDIPSNGSRKASSATAGIATATSTITSATASQRPTRTMVGAATPSTSVTAESQGVLNIIASAFKDPARRTQSIGILVAVVVGFILIVALMVFLWWFLRRQKKDRQNNGMPPSGDGEKGEMNISAPINQTTQQEIANYDPSAEIMADSAGLNYGPSQPSQLDTALVNRASRLSASRNSFLDIYGGANTPYPQDVVDGAGRPLTQQFLMPNAEKFQDFQVSGLDPLPNTDPEASGLGATDVSSSHQRNTSAGSNLSNLPTDVNPNLPAPFAGQTGPMLSSGPDLPNSAFQNPQIQPITQDPFSDDNMAPLPLVGAAANVGNPRSRPQKSRRKGARQRTDSWMTVNTVATTKAAAPSAKTVNPSTGQPSRTDYNSVYMRNPFIDPSEGAAGGAPPLPAMPPIPAHLQQQRGAPRDQQTESVTLMISPNMVSGPSQYGPPQEQAPQTPLSGPGDTEVMYGGILDDYPPRPPSTIAPQRNRAYGERGMAYAGGAAAAAVRRSDPFDLEVEDDAPDGGTGAGYAADGTVKSVEGWLSGVAEAKRNRMERENVI